MFLFILVSYIIVIVTGVLSRYVEYVKQVGKMRAELFSGEIKPFDWDDAIIESAKLPYYLFQIFKRK